MAATTIPPEFRATNRVFEEEVVGKGDFAALDRVYTQDARIMPPGAPMLQGLDNIREFWRQAAEVMGITGLTLNSDVVEVQGDTAWEIGRAEISSRGNGKVEVKYVVLWRREEAGWRWHVDIWNTSV